MKKLKLKSYPFKTTFKNIEEKIDFLEMSDFIIKNDIKKLQKMQKISFLLKASLVFLVILVTLFLGEMKDFETIRLIIDMFSIFLV